MDLITNMPQAMSAIGEILGDSVGLFLPPAPAPILADDTLMLVVHWMHRNGFHTACEGSFAGVTNPSMCAGLEYPLVSLVCRRFCDVIRTCRENACVTEAEPYCLGCGVDGETLREGYCLACEAAWFTEEAQH